MENNKNVFEILMDKVSEKTMENSTVSETDYVKDGLLYCGKCHTQKQTVVNFLGVEKIQYCMCRCETEAVEREEQLIRQSEYDRETEVLRDKAFPLCRDFSPSLPPRDDMRKWTFASDNNSNPEIMQMAKEYANNFSECFREGFGFLFYGNIGSGKSYVSACIANALVEKRYPVLMTTIANIKSDIQSTQAVYDSLNRLALLIIDDLATESDSDYTGEIVFSVINNRISAGLPLIITTNLTKEELANPNDVRYKRLFSRIKSRCLPVKFNGSDQRRKIAEDTYTKMSKILNLKGVIRK
ncbi:MAG: ATP-binding protein [Ruminococcus sp.]|nr:ATP-binding protein [Ruminococcus sp.]